MGDALSDPPKIVVDEDVLRDRYTDEVISLETQGIPEYIISLTSEDVAGLGYKGRIPSQFIELVSMVKKPEEDEI